MITKLSISGFRGLKDICLNNLTDICLITGDNSSGKTAILESIYISLTTHTLISSMPGQFRHTSKDAAAIWDNYWLWLFAEKTMPGNFKISLKYDNHLLVVEAGATEDGLAINYNLDNASMGSLRMQKGGMGGSMPGPRPKVTLFNSRDINSEADAEKFSSLSSTKDGEDQILNLVRIIDNRIQKMRYLKLPNNKSPLVYIDIGLNNFIPSSQLGQGFCTLFSLCLEMLTSNTDILLVDEIENGLHRDSLGKIWDGLAKTICSRKIQLFVTTHSKECINAAHEAAIRNEIVTFSHHILRLKGKDVTCESSEGAI